ncbi:MAG: VWA domain-containing protein [Planctomycetes bacterium]|nr:VWA domain-containing protein [Planctomycetota bacterium]
MSGFRIKAQPQNLCRIYLIDDSASVFLDNDKLLASINANIKQLGRNDVSRILYLTSTDKTVTNIEKAILSAKGSFPAGYRKEILLFSDGNETEGDARKVIPYLKQEGITLYTIPIGPNEIVDIKIDSVEAPKFVREGQPIELKCRISSTVNTMVDIQVYSNGKLIGEADRISLLKDQDNLVVVNLQAQAEPIQYYEINVSSRELHEIVVENNTRQEVIQKIGKPKVLYFPSIMISNPVHRMIPRIIGSDNAFELKIGDIPNAFKLYDIIIIDNLHFNEIPFVKEVIIPFVSNGGGLLIVGGQNSFGLGNYQNSEFEKILPVYATPPEDLSLVVILDASGSMDEISGVAGKNKFQVASEALESFAALLSKIDRLEVMAFNQGYETILPFQNADDIVSKLKDGIARVRPTGPTAILPPLQRAINTLSNSPSAKRHIILLSDGHSTTNEALDGFKQMADKLRQNNITISVIATGGNINEETLKALTKEGGGGKIYRLNSKDKDSLAVNLKEDLSAHKGFYREAESLVVSALIKDDILKGIGNIPQISGYNRTALKPNSRLAASVLGGEPIIADWQYGLGRVMVLTTSLDSKWTVRWDKWNGLGQMITQSLRYLTADIGQNQLFDISTEVLADGSIKLVVKAPDNLQLDAQVEPLTEMATDIQTVRILQVAIGKYEAILPSQEGIVISVFYQKEGSKQLLGRVPVVAQYASEWRRFTPDMGFLRNIAGSTGGKLFTADEFIKGATLNAINNKSETSYRNISAILILAALGVFLADLLIRR